MVICMARAAYTLKSKVRFGTEVIQSRFPPEQGVMSALGP